MPFVYAGFPALTHSGFSPPFDLPVAGEGAIRTIGFGQIADGKAYLFIFEDIVMPHYPYGPEHDSNQRHRSEKRGGRSAVRGRGRGG